MTAAAGGWERHPDGTHISVPISWRDLDDVRTWCAENCAGDYIIVLGRRVVFEHHDDAALAALWWCSEED